MFKYFITATDTDAGKTFVATTIVKALVNAGHKVAVYKPISAGCDLVDGDLINQDALLLQQVANCNQSIKLINPIVFEEPIAPHIAANKNNVAISVDEVCEGYSNIISLAPDYVITEGAGGWRLPLGKGNYLSDFTKQTQQQVILVVNMKLGCLNHAVLTYESIISDALTCIGWVANCIEPMPYLQENIDELQNLLSCPMIAQLDNDNNIDNAVNKINLSLLS